MPREARLRAIQRRLKRAARDQADPNGTHASHCCPVHGCKYGRPACPIERGLVDPSYPPDNGCEACAYDRDEAERLLSGLTVRLHLLEDGARWQPRDIDPATGRPWTLERAAAFVALANVDPEQGRYRVVIE